MTSSSHAARITILFNNGVSIDHNSLYSKTSPLYQHQMRPGLGNSQYVPDLAGHTYSTPALKPQRATCRSDIDSGSAGWYRSNGGTYSGKKSRHGEQQHTIANCGVAISKIVFRVIYEHTAVELTVTIADAHGTTSTTMTKTLFSDEVGFA